MFPSHVTSVYCFTMHIAVEFLRLCEVSVYVLDIFCWSLVFNASRGTRHLHEGQLSAGTETAVVVSSEEYLVDWGYDSDVEEEDTHNVSDQNCDSDADRAICVSQDMISYIAWKGMFAEVKWNWRKCIGCD